MYIGYGYYYLVVIGAIICLLASARVKFSFNRYSKIRSQSGLTGREAAERMLRENGIYDVEVCHIRGSLTDNYNPSAKTLNLSDSVYNSTSVAAVGVAAHECGHAIQHQNGYVPLNIRSAIVPVANIGSYAAWPLIVIGLFLTPSVGNLMIIIGILCFSLSVLFQLVTLPVEFNASNRALAFLRESNMLEPEELKYTKRVLKSAALTYVAAAAAAILQLLRLVLMFGGRRRD